LDANDRSCDNGDFITNGEYVRVESYTNSIHDLLNVYPSMEHLLECQNCKRRILSGHCWFYFGL